MKIVVNKCYGGFYLSLKCMKRYYGLKGLNCYNFKDGIGNTEGWLSNW